MADPVEGDKSIMDTVKEYWWVGLILVLVIVAIIVVIVVVYRKRKNASAIEAAVTPIDMARPIQVADGIMIGGGNGASDDSLIHVVRDRHL